MKLLLHHRLLLRRGRRSRLPRVAKVCIINQLLLLLT